MSVEYTVGIAYGVVLSCEEMNECIDADTFVKLSEDRVLINLCSYDSEPDYVFGKILKECECCQGVELDNVLLTDVIKIQVKDLCKTFLKKEVTPKLILYGRFW